MRVPAEAGLGKAKVIVSFPDWKDGKVGPVTFEVPVVEDRDAPPPPPPRLLAPKDKGKG